jgi:hypothetical protein
LSRASKSNDGSRQSSFNGGASVDQRQSLSGAQSAHEDNISNTDYRSNQPALSDDGHSSVKDGENEQNLPSLNDGYPGISSARSTPQPPRDISRASRTNSAQTREALQHQVHLLQLSKEEILASNHAKVSALKTKMNVLETTCSVKKAEIKVLKT